MNRVVTIIGAGMMGSALAFPAAENGHEVRLVGSPLDDDIIDTCIATGRHPKFERDFPKGVKYYKVGDWRKAVEGCDFVIGGVSSFGVDWFGDEILANLNPALPVLSVTKGLINLEDGTLISYPDYWRKNLLAKGIDRYVCAVGGSCTSYELVFKDHTAVTYCGAKSADLKLIREAMSTPYYHISLTNDVVGLESAVALKNAYALAVAMTIGLVYRNHGKDAGLHYNSQSSVFGQAAREMARFIAIQGGTQESLNVGIADLYVTIYGGRTRKVGILLGEGKSCEEALEILAGETLESLVVVRRVAKAIYRKAELGEVSLSDFPLLCHASEVIENGKDAELPWESFIYDYTE